MKAKLMGLLAAVTSGMIYGVLPFLAKSVYAAGGNSFTLVFLRMVIGAVVFSLLHRITSADSLAVGRKERKNSASALSATASRRSCCIFPTAILPPDWRQRCILSTLCLLWRAARFSKRPVSPGESSYAVCCV